MVTQLEKVFTADEKSILESEAKRILGELVQLDQYVGDVYSIAYESALVQIHDKHRQQVGGIPSLSFLIATRVESGSRGRIHDGRDSSPGLEENARVRRRTSG